MCDSVLFIQDGRMVEKLDKIQEIKNITNPYAKKLLHSVIGIDV